MSRIVCATRAGEGSRAVQIAAIDYARHSGQDLTFLYVIDPNSLGEIDEAIWEPLRQELTWMGKTLLRIAEKRAEDAGLRATLVICQGNIRDEICNHISHAGATRLFLGAPRGTSANIFGDDEIEIFAQSIQDTTGVPVEIVRPDEKDAVDSAVAISG